MKIIEEETLDKIRITETETTEEILTVSVLAVNNATEQAIMLKSIVPDLEWFDGNQTKFEDCWRGIQLFLKSNRVIMTDDRIITILSQLRKNIAGIYI